MANEPPSIIRITKQQVDRAKQAAKTARNRDPHFRAFIEEQEKHREDITSAVGKIDTDAATKMDSPGFPEYLNLTDPRMNLLPPTFSLTPRESYFEVRDGYEAWINVFGTVFHSKQLDNREITRFCFDEMHANDELLFSASFAADPEIDYTTAADPFETMRFQVVPYIAFYYDLTSVNPRARQLNLDFHYDVHGSPGSSVCSRLLVYTDFELVSDLKLYAGTNRFHMEVEDLGPNHLIFIHSRLEDSMFGGNMFFQGITGYVTP